MIERSYNSRKASASCPSEPLSSDSSSDSEAEDVELQGCEDTEFAELSAAKRAFTLPNIAQPGKQSIQEGSILAVLFALLAET
jgi:hypothetical protein